MRFRVKDLKHSTVVTDPGSCCRRQHLQNPQDPLVIHANIPLENWFMVGNPVPQRTQSIELVVQFSTFRLRGEYQMQVCTPESVVVGLAE